MRVLARIHNMAIILALALAVLGGCTTVKVPLTELEVPMPDPLLREWPKLSDIPFLGSGDFRGQSWPEAFDALHLKLSREYPFTEWKGIDWNLLYAEYHPEIVRATEENDQAAYYLALRKYLYAIPDGNVSLEMNAEQRDRAIGGSYGFSVLPLADGRIVAYHIAKDRSAARAGMQWGAEIISWNTLPVNDALEQSVTLWADTPAATRSIRLLRQCRFLTRAPVDSRAVVVFQNPNHETAWVASLTAKDDDYTGIQETLREGKEFSNFGSPIAWAVLPSGYGHIRIFFEAPTLFTPFPARAFRKALSTLMDENVPGLIIDLRSNLGGADKIAAKFAGHFVTEETLYRDVTYCDAATGAFVAASGNRITVEPRDPHFEGPVVVLVHPGTVGAGEGLAMALQRLPNAQTLGVFNSCAAFGVPGGEITMPGGYAVFYPQGRPVDANGRILLESDAAGQGGVSPDIQAPITLDVLDAFFNHGEDILLNRAVEALDEAVKAQTGASGQPGE